MNQRWIWAVALIFGARYLLTAWFEPVHDSDLAWQQWLGHYIVSHHALPSALGPEAFAAQGSPWVPQEWALSLAVAAVLGTAWFPLLAVAMVLVTVSVLFITANAASRMGASHAAAAICCTAVGFSMVQSVGVRAQVFGWMMLALFMFVVRTAPGRAKWWCVAIAAAWANLHASAMLAPVLLGLYTAGIALEERAITARVRGYALLTIACAGAICLTPLGVRLPVYALTLFSSPIRSVIDEWQPTTINSIGFAAGVLPFILAMALLGFAKPWRWREVLLFAAMTVLSLTAGRNIPIAAIVIAPLVAQRLTQALPARFEVGPLNNHLERIMFAALAVSGSLLIGVMLARQPDVRKPSIPLRAVEVAAAVPGTHRLFCEDFAWCSWALRHTNMSDFIDGRCDPFPARVWNQYTDVYEVKPRWRSILDRENIDLVLTKRTRPLAQALALSGWRKIYTDSTYALFMRRAG